MEESLSELGRLKSADKLVMMGEREVENGTVAMWKPALENRWAGDGSTISV